MLSRHVHIRSLQCVKITCKFTERFLRNRILGSSKLAGWTSVTRINNPWTYLQVKLKRSKVKVTRPINAHNSKCAISSEWEGLLYELQTWYTDGGRRPTSSQAPWPPRSKVKDARSRDASDRCRPIRRERNCHENTKIVGRLPTPRALRRSNFKVKGQGHQVD